MTPRGGTGMNTAIHDGRDLGWKLAWVLRGWAEPALLDTYEAERRPVAEHNVGALGRPRGPRPPASSEELRVDLGGAHRPPLAATAAGRARSTLDLLGPGLTLLTGPDRDAWEATAGAVAGSAPVVVRSVDAISARALGFHGRGALLARPDGVAIGLWSSADRATAPSPELALA